MKKRSQLLDCRGYQNVASPKVPDQLAKMAPTQGIDRHKWFPDRELNPGCLGESQESYSVGDTQTGSTTFQFVHLKANENMVNFLLKTKSENGIKNTSRLLVTMY